MTDSNTKLYWYEDIIELVVTTDLPGIYQDNRPMNHRKIKAHKGLTNEIVFHVRDRDRKLQDMATDTLRAYIINPETRRRVLTKELEVLADIGKVKLRIDAGDIETLKSGMYTIYIVRGSDNNIDRPLYTDQDNNVRFEIEITDQVGVDPIDTQIETELLQTASSPDIFVSNAMLGNLERNFSNAQHTLALYLNEYTGNLTIQGSCLESVPATDHNSTDWFSMETIEVTDATVTVIPRTFIVNANWIRVVSTPITGSLEKIVLRN